MSIDKERVKAYFCRLQDHICEALQREEGEKVFREDRWQRQEGGGGISRVLEGGAVIEKGGVNFSHVTGAALPPSATATRPELAGRSFEAMGVSLVIHPKNPYAPTSHMNVRFFIAESDNEQPIWWFGGGFDLTPYYGFDEDCQHWHQMAAQACQQMDESLYPEFKQACDEYFHIRHRNEARGIGGLFFDDFNRWDFEKSFELTRAIGDHYLLAYLPILQKRKSMEYGEREIEFQHYRRGRYVEFNLVYDRGTLFGLQTGGRTESILMSLPAHVSWRYDWHPPEGSPEALLYERYLVPRNWLTNDMDLS